MAEFIYTTSTTISGPWLIDSDKLEALDKTLDEEWERIAKRNGEVEEPSLYHLNERSVTIYLKANKKIIVGSFSEAMRQPNLLEEMPIGFQSVLLSGEIKGEIELRVSGQLDLTVSPEHLTESRELFAALHRWVTTVRPPKWQQLWIKFNPLQWALWITVLVIGLQTMEHSRLATENFYKEQAKQLLQDGLSQDEQSKAIEILLGLESEYVSQAQNTSLPGWFKFLVVGGLIACIVLTITPKPRIGIGKGQDAINRWRLWIRIVFIVVPGFIVVNIIWPYLSRLFPSLF